MANVVEELQCRSCDAVLPLSEFTKRAGAPLGVIRLCKKCSCAVSARWNDAHAEQVLDSRLRRDFGITLEDFNILLRQQGGVCAICGQPPRGVFGRKDRPEVVRSALKYLEG